MNCDAFENRILDYHENQLSDDDRELVEHHLAGCSNCQAFARRLDRLNAALSRQLRTPKLPAEFDARLMQRIQIETVMLSETERTERKRQMQLEYESGQARLRRPQFVSSQWMAVLAYTVATAGAGWGLWQFTPALTNFLSTSGLGSPGKSLVLLLASGSFVLVVLVATLPRQFRRRWSVT